MRRKLEFMNEVEKASADVELVDLTEDEIPKDYYKVSVDDLSSLGLAGDSLQKFIQTGVKPGGEGIYKVTFPEGFEGTSLSHFKDEDAYLGSGIKDGKMTQARLRQVTFDPTETFMAFALMSIQHKLNEISEVQHEILDFLYAEKESELSGDLKLLDQVLEDYKFNWNDDESVKHDLMQVANVKKDALQNVDLYRSQINEIKDAPVLPHAMIAANKQITKMQRFMQNYHSAVYIYAYSIYIEDLLLKKFDDANISNVRNRLENEAKDYSVFIQECFDWINRYLTSSIDYAIGPAYRGFDKVYESILKRIPSHFDFDKVFAGDHDKFLSADERLKKSEHDKNSDINVFANALDEIEYLKQNQLQMYIKGNNMYIPYELIENVTTTDHEKEK